VVVENEVVLLVEDNPDDEALTLRALERIQVNAPVVVVRDGAECIAYLHGGPSAPPQPLPRLVLLDLNLPKLGGIQVLRRLRADARTKLLPVVVLTTSKEDEDIIGSYKGGANAYVRKQLDFTRFTEAMRLIDHFWLRLNEAPSEGRS
jgi:two-component system response regulator